MSKPVIAFEHIAKTAGTTMKFILRNSFGISHCDTHIARAHTFNDRDLRTAKRIFPGLKSLSGHNIRKPVEQLSNPGMFYLTVLREPVKRCISHFQDNCLRHGNELSLEKWLEIERLQNLQVKHIAGTPDVEKAKAYVKQHYHLTGLSERFDETLKLLQVLAPYSINLRYLKRVVAKDNTIKNRILADPEKVALVEHYNKLDMEL